MFFFAPHDPLLKLDMIFHVLALRFWGEHIASHYMNPGKYPLTLVAKGGRETQERLLNMGIICSLLPEGLIPSHHFLSRDPVTCHCQKHAKVIKALHQLLSLGTQVLLP